MDHKKVLLNEMLVAAEVIQTMLAEVIKRGVLVKRFFINGWRCRICGATSDSLFDWPKHEVDCWYDRSVSHATNIVNNAKALQTIKAKEEEAKHHD